MSLLPILVIFMPILTACDHTSTSIFESTLSMSSLGSVSGGKLRSNSNGLVMSSLTLCVRLNTKLMEVKGKPFTVVAFSSGYKELSKQALSLHIRYPASVFVFGYPVEYTSYR